MPSPLETALRERDDLDQYGSAKRSLFALQMYKALEDIHSVAASALTDGPDDKSCDVVYVDRDAHNVVIIQGYESDAPTGKKQAPVKKAASVHQALNWLLGDLPDSSVPERLRSARKELHEALADGVIDSVEVWFVHNLPESVQIGDELTSAAVAARSTIEGRYPESSIDVVGVEIGQAVLEDRYRGSKTPILITDSFEIQVHGGFVETGDNWEAVCTSLDSTWLREQFEQHKELLFSANIRGYLGSTRQQGNINHGIQATAREEPARFWAYNNGITALVHDFTFDQEAGLLTITGLAIVNGAQTTGAIGALDPNAVGAGRVLARFIKCGDPSTVQEIIRYNNRQNPTQASDFRSNDRVQSRLVAEFTDLGVEGYNGGRRGGAEDVIRRPGNNQIQATMAAQALAALHGRPEIAYHQKGQIWEDDAVYAQVFPERVSARHILFACGLLRAVEDAKSHLVAIDPADLNEAQTEQLRWLSLRGSIFLLVAAVGSVLEPVLNRTIADRYALKFAEPQTTLVNAAAAWRPVVDVALSLAPSQLTNPLLAAGALRNRAELESALAAYRALFGATTGPNRPIYEQFGKLIA